MVFTTNVDGHFQKAGFEPEQIIECHGSIHHLQCVHGCDGSIWAADAFEPEVDDARCLLVNAPPRCSRCGALARPNILMFDDADWLPGRSDAQQRNLALWLNDPEGLVILEVGAGTTVATARYFSSQVATQLKSPLLRINPQEAELPADVSGVALPLGAELVLQELLHLL